MTPTPNPESEMTPEKAKVIVNRDAKNAEFFSAGYSIVDSVSIMDLAKAKGFLQGVAYQEEKAKGLEKITEALIVEIEGVDAAFMKNPLPIGRPHLFEIFRIAKRLREAFSQYQSSSNARQAEGDSDEC